MVFDSPVINAFIALFLFMGVARGIWFIVSYLYGIYHGTAFSFVVGDYMMPEYGGIA
jgi:hypothetical protein